MTGSLRTAWQSRSPRERRVLAVLMVVIATALFVLLVMSAHRARQNLRPAVAALRAEALAVDRSAEEISRLNAMPITPPARSDLRLLVQAQVDSNGLSQSLPSLESLDADHVQIAFANVPFSDWLAFVDKLQAQHLRIDSASIDALSTPGRVAVTAILARTGP